MCDRYRHDLVRDWATSLRCDAIFSVFKIGDGVIVQISENKDFSLPALQRLLMFKFTGRQIAADDAPMTGDPNHLLGSGRRHSRYISHDLTPVLCK